MVEPKERETNNRGVNEWKKKKKGMRERSRSFWRGFEF